MYRHKVKSMFCSLISDILLSQIYIFFPVFSEDDPDIHNDVEITVSLCK